MTEHHTTATPRYLNVAPDSCLGEVNRLSWRSTSVVRVGEYHIGIRSNTLSVQEALETALRRHLVDDPQARGSFAIYEGQANLKGARPLYRVYRDCHHIFTTPSLDRAVAFSASQLEQFLPRKAPPMGLVELGAAALVGSESTVIVPWFLPYKESHAEMRAQRQGVRLFEGSSVLIDTSSAELVVLPSRLLDATLHTGGGLEAQTPPGRFPIAGWVFFGYPREGAGRAHAVVRGLRVSYWHDSPAANFSMLATLVRQLDVSVVGNLGGVLKRGLAYFEGGPG